MGLKSKIFGSNTKVLPVPGFDSIHRQRSNSWDSDDSASTGVPTPCSESTVSGSWASTRPHSTTSRGSSALRTPRAPAQRRRPLVDVISPTSVSSRRSRDPFSSEPGSAGASPWTCPATFERRKGGRREHQFAHLIAPVQPWNEFVEGYAKNLVEKVGGKLEAWIDVMSLDTAEVRGALTLSMMTPRKSNKPRPMPQEISKVVNKLLDSLPPAYRNNTAKLDFALHERPFYCTALEKHVELVLWGLIASRNAWM